MVGADNGMYFFGLQVDEPITGGAYKRQFTVCLCHPLKKYFFH